MDNLLKQIMLETYQKQQYDELRQEAERARLLKRAKSNERQLRPRKEAQLMNKRRLAYLVAIVFIVALFVAQVAQAAAGGGGGGGYLVM